MTFKEIIDELNHIFCGLYVSCSREELDRKHEAIHRAIDLLRTHQDNQPNEPLTLEELREMDSQPVWVELGPGYEGRWALVQVWAKSTNIIYLIQANGSVLHLKAEIDNGAKLYRHPPKED